MDLTKLFKAQKELDDRIIKEKGLEGQYLLDKKILALQVELGELANEWRGFKFWSENQEPNTECVCELCEGRKDISALTDTGSVGETYEVYDVYEVDVVCPLCEGYDNDENPLLEEYVDCLHFILSIGNDIEVNDVKVVKLSRKDPLYSFAELYSAVPYLRWVHMRKSEYKWLLSEFIELGRLLGFTWEQIEQGYFEKNKVNHKRQVNGY